MQDRERLTWNVNETARLLGLSKNFIYQGVLTGQIPHLKIGRRILIPRAAILKWLDATNRSGSGEAEA